MIYLSSELNANDELTSKDVVNLEPRHEIDRRDLEEKEL